MTPNDIVAAQRKVRKVTIPMLLVLSCGWGLEHSYVCAALYCLHLTLWVRSEIFYRKVIEAIGVVK